MQQRGFSGPARHQDQRGVVAIVFGLALAVIMGFTGLALDSGRLYVAKSELQNAADACALAAAQELDPTAGTLTAAAFAQARDAGVRVATRNRADFQQSSVQTTDVTVEFASAVGAATWDAAAAASNDAFIARCRVVRSDLQPWFMRALGATAATVTAVAAATRKNADHNCALPPGLCTNVSSLVQ